MQTDIASLAAALVTTRRLERALHADIGERFRSFSETSGATYEAWAAGQGRTLHDRYEATVNRAEQMWQEFLDAPVTDLLEMAAKMRALSSIFRAENEDAELLGVWTVPGPMLEDAIAGCFGPHRQAAA